MTEDQVREALRVCFDPELPVNIVDLGLIYGVRISRDTEATPAEPRYRVHVTLTMRAPNEEREPMLLAQVTNRLSAMPQVSRVSVDVVWVPPWSTERISQAARQQLGLDRPARQGPERPARQGLVKIKLP